MENGYNLETLYQFVIEKLLKLPCHVINDASGNLRRTHETVDGNPSSEIGA